MTLEEAIKKNPYDPAKGNEAAYVRYLRYNVDGFYDLDSRIVRRIWEESRKKPCDDCQEFDCYGCEYAERKEE